MDENYLDDLLGQVSSDNTKQNKGVDPYMDIDLSDLGDISLDELDGLDDIDLSGLELDDIDFDDVDVLSLDTDKVKRAASKQEEEDFNLDDLIEETSNDESDTQYNVNMDDEQDVFADADMQLTEDTTYPEVMSEDIASLFDNTDKEDTQQSDNKDFDSVADFFSGMKPEGDVALQSEGQDIAGMDLDDLFSALGIESDDNDSEDEGSAYTSGQDELDDLLQASMEISFENGELDDIDDISEVKPEASGKKKKSRNSKHSGKDKTKSKGGEAPKTKRTISEILFGEPDSDDIEEDRLFEERQALKKVEKEKQKALKEEKKAAKEEKKLQTLELKKAAGNKKANEKALKKKEKQEELEAELEAEKGQKKVPTAVVIIVFALFALLGVTVVFGTKEFNYSQVIRKAADYFERQRYRLAYDEVSGVEVKDKDEDLKDRIYTVMYVERLYESYENNMELGRPDKALDALLRGLQKYDEHYEEAIELDIVEDILLCRTKILFALADTYGLSETDAYSIMDLEGQEYTQTLINYSEGLQTGE